MAQSTVTASLPIASTSPSANPQTPEITPLPSGAQVPPVSSTTAAAAPEVNISTEAVSPLYSMLVPPQTPQAAAGDELLKFMEERKILFYSKDRWNRMRDDLEHGRKPGEAKAPAPTTTIISSTITAPTAAPLPPGLSVDLPYESQLSISGRKLIGVNLKSTIYDQPEAGRRVNSTSFDMAQELQVRIKGRVGKKINVNVDFDDTKDDKRDISVVYKGDPEEVVQEAAFGDINMTLPSTEFVGYSRQLFGVKLDTRYKKLRTQGFFSRTKGLSEVKRFTGNTSFNRVTIADTNYIRMKYYSIGATAGSIIVGSVRVYQDDIRNDNNTKVIISTTTNPTLAALNNPASTSQGNFDLLVAGQDYTVDYQTGILTFRNTLGTNYIIAVDYQLSDGTFLSQTGTPGPKIIKDANNTVGITTELRTFYSLGNIKIIRDNGRGNFILKVQDLNGNTPATLEPGGLPVPTYSNNLTVDFENGIFYFNPPTSLPFPPDVYTLATHRYNFLSEYRYRIKIVTLRAGIVPQSERVTIAGKIMKRDEDYFIDYDAGIVTFLHEENINEDTVIEISYDYAPFGGGGASTLVGARSELSLTNNIFVGATYIYDFAARTQTVPDIRTAPTSLWVGEVDSKVQNVKVPLTSLTVSVSGEVAMSERDPNIMGKAIVESMEGIRQEDSASLFADQWQYSANPAVPAPAPRYNANDISWSNFELPRKEINPRLDTTTDDRQQVLQINYNLTRSNELSIVQPLSTSGIDYSKKLYLEMWVKGDNNGEGLAVSYGTFNEDADGSGVIQTEDTDRNGILGPNEDIGWAFHNPDGTVTRFGANNGKLDTEDLNGNGFLDTFDTPAAPGPYGPASGRSVIDDQGFSHQSIDWNDWRFIRIPLTITNAEDWKNIRQVRLTLSGSGVGSIIVGGITIVGNKWDTFGENSAIGSTVTVSAISNENAGYVSLIGNKTYDDLYNDEDTNNENKVEQALRLNYLVPPATATVLGAKLVYSRVYDFSAYGALKFFVFVSSEASIGDTLVFQAGGNDQNYFEYSMPLPADWLGRWQLVTINQTGNSSRADHWVAVDPRATVSIAGAPSLQNISQIKVGVRSAVSAGFKSGEIWINEIHVADSLKKAGSASRLNVDFAWPGWGRVGGATFGGSRKEVSRNFETFSGGIYNRDYLEDSGYLGFKGFNVAGLTLIPFNTRLTRTRTTTPSVVQNQSDLLSILDEGRVTNYSGTGETTLNLGRYFPQLTGRYTRALTDTRQIQRLEDRDSFSGTLNYDNPIKFIFFPTNFNGSYSMTNSYFKIYPSTTIEDSDGYLDLGTANKYLEITDYHTLEMTETWGLKTPFQITQLLSIIPNYNLTTVKEKNKDFTVEQRYPKSLNQNVGASSSLKLFTWFQPNFNYSINTRENYNLNIDTQTQPQVNPAKTKYIERNSSGEMTWNVQVRDLVKNRYVQSLGITSSYRIQDSDSYDNVESTFNPVGASFDKLWIRDNPLKDPLTQGTTGYIVKSIVRKDDVRVAGRYNPFEAFVIGGRLAPLRTLSANFTYTGSEEHSLITGTQKDIYTTVWPDLILGLNQWERMVSLENWISDSQLNLRHQKKTVDTIKVDTAESLTYGTDLRCSVKKKVDVSLSFNTTSSKDHEFTRNITVSEAQSTSWSGQGGFLLGLWRFTVRYDNAQSWTKDSVGALTAQAISNGVTALVNSDMSFPKGLPLPFTRRTIPMTNRLIFNSTVKYITKSSVVNLSDNTDNYGLTSSAEYEVSKNFRLSFGLGYNRYIYRDDAKQNYTSLEASSRLTIQF
jgi:hypothetical protein